MQYGLRRVFAFSVYAIDVTDFCLSQATSSWLGESGNGGSLPCVVCGGDV